MPNFTVDQIRELMDKKRNIRNMSVIAHVDHGKTTLTDSLVAAAGIIATPKAGDVRFCQAREDEQQRGITIKSTAVSLFYSMPHFAEWAEDAKEARRVLKSSSDEEEDKKEDEKKDEKKDDKKEEERTDRAGDLHNEKIDGTDFLINVIDSPGHVDFSSEVTAALRVTDGAMVVVDCIEGVCVQTETVLRQAISERIRPVLWVNKADRPLIELSMDLEDSYQCFARSVESANVIIEQFKDPTMGDIQVNPLYGTVGFGSGLAGWGFTLGIFANMYASKFGMDRFKMRERMWGSHFLNPKTKKWCQSQFDDDGKKNIRGFVHYILKPLSSLFTAVMGGEKDKYEAQLKALGIKIPQDAKEADGRFLLKRIMQTWLPAHEALLNMIVVHLPSPVIAQKYRTDILYTGDLKDPICDSMRACDPNGPMCMFVSKMVPTSDKGRFYAFGRIFSGVVKTNQSVTIFGPDYNYETKNDLFVGKKIQRTVLMMGRYTEQIPDCPCGNVIGLVGVDTFLLKAGTITELEPEKCMPFKAMKFSVSPVVRCAVDVKNQADLPKLVEGLRRLGKSDPLVLITTSKTGEHVVAGAGELHLEICLKDLADDFMKGAPIVVSEPVVSFCETITTTSVDTCVAKSTNKHNRVYLIGEPIPDGLAKKIETREIREDDKDPKKRTKILVDDFKWNKTDAQKIWTFGCPPEARPNVFVDCTKGASFLSEIRDHVISAFIQATAAGVLVDEPWRGIRVNLTDIVLHADAIHRGAGQITPCAKKGLYGVQLNSGPRLLEPYYLCEISVPQTAISGVFQTLTTRRGRVLPEEEEQVGALQRVRAYLPVLESFGFTGKLRQNTGGKAFPQMVFDHWETLDGDNVIDINDAKTKTYIQLMEVRKRKGMKLEIPQFADYYDRIQSLGYEFFN